MADHPWIPTLGISYHLAADGISLAMLLLTGIIAVAGVLFSWNITHRLNEFFGFYFLLVGSVFGVFLSYDVFLLFVFYEIVVIPKYFLIAIWGSTRKDYAAMKLVLYSFVGSALVLIGLIAAYVESGSKSMSLAYLAGYPFPAHFPDVVLPRRLPRLRHPGRPVSRSTPGRPPATSPPPPPPPCSSPASS